MKIRLTLIALALLLSAPVAAQDLTVISYNIRYNSDGDGDDLWDLRKAELVEQIKAHEPSSFGVQEATHTQMLYLAESLPDYAYVGVGRDDGSTKGEYSAIFYQKVRFEVLQSGTFWLSDTPKQISTGWDAALPRICTYAQLKERASARQFWHFNTHFDHMGQEARAESATLIIREIKRLAEPESALVVTGDFNAQPQELPIMRMKEAMIDPLDQLELKGPVGTFSGFQLDAPLDRRIDYIFVQGLNPTSYEHLGEKRANGRWISDHLAVKIKVSPIN